MKTNSVTWPKDDPAFINKQTELKLVQVANQREINVYLTTAPGIPGI
jgi:hypothetical protein